MTFGEKLKQIRLERNISQQELANLLDTSKQVISRYELGQTSPKIGTAARWCQILGINLDNMLNDDKSLYGTSENTTPNPSVLEDDELLMLLNEIHSRPELQMLFSVSRECTKEEVLQAVRIIEVLRSRCHSCCFRHSTNIHQQKD